MYRVANMYIGTRVQDNSRINIYKVTQYVNMTAMTVFGTKDDNRLKQSIAQCDIFATECKTK